MIVNGFKAGGTIEFLSNMAQISQEKVNEIIRNYNLMIDDKSQTEY